MRPASRGVPKQAPAPRGPRHAAQDGRDAPEQEE